jgi:hypothetical protein
VADSAIALYESGEITVFRPPEDVLAEAQRAAHALQDVIKQTNAVIKLGNSEHLKSEAWQTLGHFYGLTARIKETRFVDYGGVRGFEAFAELVHVKTGNVVSTGEAMCLSDEEKWSTRSKYEWQNGPNGREKVKVGEEQVPLFQLRSMAQTRAISKTHSNALKWVVVLAGYSPTPAEEVDENTVENHAALVGISEKQWKALWGKAFGKKLTADDIGKWLTDNGVDTKRKGADITPARYEALIKALEAM